MTRYQRLVRLIAARQAHAAGAPIHLIAQQLLLPQATVIRMLGVG